MANKVHLRGNVGHDPEFTTTNGIAIATFTLATNQRWMDKNTGQLKEAVEWHNITAWRRQAEIIRDFVKKGSQLYVEGRLQTQSWESDKDGVQNACGRKHHKTVIVLEKLELCDRKPGANGEDASVVDDAAQLTPATVTDDDIPF